MSKEVLDEREFELVNIIGAQLAANQRDLSRQIKMSLGMTNMLLRRLITKGYIRIRQLNQKKVQYILTPKGFAEKYRKSINYTLKTIRSIGFIRRQLDIIIGRLYDQGERAFFIFGNSDLVELVEMTLGQSQWKGIKFDRGEQLPANFKGAVLVCRGHPDLPQLSNGGCVDLVEELAKQDKRTNSFL